MYFESERIDSDSTMKLSIDSDLPAASDSIVSDKIALDSAMSDSD